ncbi:uracil-DNA glycosylase family protein [Salimicrobium flavidum]|uniref:Uracil-DNA glycosylase-like domain-containing protein n=1 Tax=Salimicrobium flavidum TaxID=570947 RepID=A0A1N7KTU1_9BACI|nr:uracil-DNA glycosylase family protein [Salimicrobium flavidum]SIS64850.1 hypothetical protein SAMN05421687_1186 [Salimicrobium flavidum]
MSVNQQLYELYERKWEELQREIYALSGEERPTHPLLLKVPDEAAYEQADMKVMIVGKETNDWEGRFGKHSLTDLQEFYADFLANDTKAKHTLFWRYPQELFSSLQERGSVSFVWNNIYKIGKAGKKGKPSRSVRNINQQSFQVFKEELEILKPDIVLFLTGPGYDKVLKSYLPGLTHESMAEGTKREMVRCIHPSLPSIALRTYHPQYLNTRTPEKGPFHRDTPKEALLRMVSER